MLKVGFGLELLHRGEHNLPSLQSKKSGSFRRLGNDMVVGSQVLLKLDKQKFQGTGGKFGSHISVKWSRGSSLLNVSEDIDTGGKLLLSFRVEQVLDKIGGKVLVGPLVSDDQVALGSNFHLRENDLHVIREILDGERLFEDVSVVSTRTQGRDCGKVSAVSSHCLDNEDSSLSSCGRLLYLVNHLTNLIESRIRSKRNHGTWKLILFDENMSHLTWDVVGDGARDDAHWNAKLWVLLTVVGKDHGAVVSLKSSNKQQSLDIVFLQLLGNLWHGLSGWKALLGTKERSSVHGPVGHVRPLEFFEQSVGKSFKTVFDSVDGTLMVESHSDVRANGGIHSSGWSSDVDDGNLELVPSGKVILLDGTHLGEQFVSLQISLETATTEHDGSGPVLLSHRLLNLLSSLDTFRQRNTDHNVSVNRNDTWL